MKFSSVLTPWISFSLRPMIGALMVGMSGSVGGAVEAIPDRVEFNRDVRPILSNACFKCHGPDTENNRSDLRLDSHENATATRRTSSGASVTAIVPGSLAESEMWARLISPEPEIVMPPPDALHQLNDTDRAVLRRWIEQGAEYEPHWAYIVPKQVAPPSVTFTAGVRNPIDNFIVRKLERLGITPHEETDPATLLRRVSLDLTGLPPTPAELDAFMADLAPGAFERVVDRLLSSVHYGERMAVPWLDLVRFADSVGFHGDQRQNIFPYRDYVIDAFNENLPYDQFVREQLAGDLLPEPTTEQIVATGFNRLNLMTREGGAQPKEYLAKSAADRVRAVSTTFMGSTVGCAECHDHKFDPFSTRDFYSLAAYFSDVKQWGVYSDYKYTPNPDLKGFNNNFPFPPERDVENAYLQRRLVRLEAEQSDRITEVVSAILTDTQSRQQVLRWAQDNAEMLREDGAGWQPVELLASQGDDFSKAELQEDGSIRFLTIPEEDRTGKDKSGVVLTLAGAAGDLAALRLEALPDPAGNGLVARNDLGSFTVSPRIEIRRAGETETTVLELAGGFVNRDSWTYSNAYLVTSVERSWRSSPAYAEEAQKVVYQLRSPIKIAPGDQLVVTLKSTDIARVQLATSPLGLRRGMETTSTSLAAALVAANRNEGAELTESQWRLLAAEYFKSTGESDPDAFAASLLALREIAACRDGRAFTMITEAAEPLTTRILPRGNWQDESGEEVAPAPPSFLDRGVPSTGERSTRLDLAEWIVDPQNPLTARTFVNRLWNQFFGTGLSAVVDDLGLQGEYPSHPELLDWMAVQFVESGWDVKAMVRLMVTSGTYRQKSDHRHDMRDIDPTNRLLASQPARRLEAEFVRDNALFVSGLLNPETGGPSVTPYQPEGYYVSLNFPKRTYRAATDERQYRRGLYTHWQRTFVNPMMANFDAPSREECTADRTVSNTPQQALTLLNDPTFVEAARALAERAMLEVETSDFTARIEHVFRLVLARPPTAEEASGLEVFYHAQQRNYTATPTDADKLLATGLRPFSRALDPVELAAWTQVGRVLLNLNETLVRY